MTVNGLATGTDWAIAVILASLSAGTIVGWMIYVTMVTRNTKWAFGEKELERFDIKGKLQKHGMEIDNRPGRGAYYKAPLAKLQRKSTLTGAAEA